MLPAEAHLGGFSLELLSQTIKLTPAGAGVCLLLPEGDQPTLRTEPLRFGVSRGMAAAARACLVFLCFESSCVISNDSSWRISSSVPTGFTSNSFAPSCCQLLPSVGNAVRMAVAGL